MTDPQSIHFHHATIVVPQNGEHFSGQLLVHEGKIVAIYRHQQPIEKPEYTHTIDANGAILTCGLVDIGVRITAPMDRTNVLADMMDQAIASGITTMAILPHSQYPLDNPEVIHFLRSTPTNHQPHLFPIAAMYRDGEPQTMSNIGMLIQAGALATLIDPWPQDISFALNLIRYAQNFYAFNAGLWINPHHVNFIQQTAVHAGLVAGRLGLAGIPHVAETVVLATLREIIAQMPNLLCQSLHFNNISCARSASLLNTWEPPENQSMHLTAGIPSMNLHFNETVILGNPPEEKRFDSRYYVSPPLRAEVDRQALCHALEKDLRNPRMNSSEKISDTMGQFLVHSNHMPVSLEDPTVPLGMNKPTGGNFATLLEDMARFAALHNLLPFEWLPAITYRPAAVLNLPERFGIGCLAIDQAADLCLFEWRDLKHNPRETYTHVKATVINGHLVYHAKD